MSISIYVCVCVYVEKKGAFPASMWDDNVKREWKENQWDGDDDDNN